MRALGALSSAELLGLYRTLLFAERWKTEFGASIKQVRCSFGCVRVAKLLCALAAQPLLQLRSQAGFVARRHGGAFDRAPHDESKQASARRRSKTRLQRIAKSIRQALQTAYSQPPQPTAGAEAVRGRDGEVGRGQGEGERRHWG